MDEAQHILEVTRRMHMIASTPEGYLLILPELERLALEELATETASGSKRTDFRRTQALVAQPRGGRGREGAGG